MYRLIKLSVYIFGLENVLLSVWFLLLDGLVLRFVCSICFLLVFSYCVDLMLLGS